jgi:hypothetical protein
MFTLAELEADVKMFEAAIVQLMANINANNGALEHAKSLVEKAKAAVPTPTASAVTAPVIEAAPVEAVDVNTSPVNQG